MVKVNNFVQWEPNGVMMLKEAGLVTKLSDCGKFAFIKGSQTGLPTNELRILKKIHLVIFDYIGNHHGENHYFEHSSSVNDFLKANLKRQDDYGLIWLVDVEGDAPIDVDNAELACLDNYHNYRRAKFSVAIRDDLNTPPDLKAYLRNKFNG